MFIVGPCGVSNCLRCELLNSNCCMDCEAGYELVNGCASCGASKKLNRGSYLIHNVYNVQFSFILYNFSFSFFVMPSTFKSLLFIYIVISIIIIIIISL